MSAAGASAASAWRAVAVLMLIAAGTTTAVASICWRMGWTVTSPQWGVLVPIAMWAPARARASPRTIVAGARARRAQLSRMTENPGAVNATSTENFGTLLFAFLSFTCSPASRSTL